MTLNFRPGTFFYRVNETLVTLVAAVAPVPSLGTRMTAAESAITSLNGRMSTAESSITSLGTRMTSAESTISTHTSTLSSHATRITALEVWRAAKAAVITKLAGNINLTGISLPLGLGVTLSKAQIEGLFNEDRAKIAEIIDTLKVREITA